ncbi:MAG: imidazole glycerol phosphate synthase subunit HisH [Clostridia bacterium]|nr:imidazole glycerol phosphate synthase subunit HisH [Clostridia bacterium]
MVAIIDYGVGNLFSLASSFSAIGEEAIITKDAETLKKADRILLPGVGAFEDAAKKLKNSGLLDTLLSEVKAGKPLLGICLGMQLLFEKSFEYGEHLGLGLISGEIRSIEETIPAELKNPHIGWNALSFAKKSPIFKYLKDGDYVYFVHSYHGVNCKEATVATTDYGATLTAAVQNENVFGCQFHPEKSGEVGLKILKAFCELEGCQC